jgi:glycosyltransferase involved in cell wall biosynthesis
MSYNGIASEILYPPVFQPERFYNRGHNNEIVYICRLEHHKRQHLLLEAMRYTRTRIRLRISGTSSGPQYADTLRSLISQHGLEDRIIIEDRWITEDEKAERLADCLAAAYLPLDEDSYGYPTVEASYASKAILTTTDSGGVLELAQHGINSYVTPPSPQALAEAMDRLYVDRQKTESMGQNARARLAELNISWPHVLQRLLA